MAAILSMKELEARKRALVAESEVYRETLKLELMNLQVYGARMQRKVASYGALKPLLFLGAPLIGSLFGRRRKALRGFFGTVLTGYRLYRGFAPLVQRLIIKSFGRSASGRLLQKGETAPAPEL
jgi:hypothetical protein